MAFYNPYFNQPAPGIVPVQTEQDVLRYPVAPGASVTMRIEGTPYIYTKTMGVSQFDQPVIEKYRLVKEDVQGPKQAEYALKSDVDELREMLKKLTEANDE